MSTAATSVGVEARDRIFALVHPADDGLVLGLVKLSPGPVTFRRRGGVWVRDRALAVQLNRRSGRRPRLRELRRRDLIFSEVSRWDDEEVRRAAAASKMYDEPVERPRPSAPSKNAVRAARWAARAARSDLLAEREDELLSAILDERRRSARLTPVTASAARLTGQTQRAADVERMRSSRASRERMAELAAVVRAGGPR